MGFDTIIKGGMVVDGSGLPMRNADVGIKDGMVTDIGIELGKLVYWNRLEPDRGRPDVIADRGKLRLLATLVTLFFSGGLAGALGFKHIGFIATAALAAALMCLAIVPIVDDFLKFRRNA